MNVDGEDGGDLKDVQKLERNNNKEDKTTRPSSVTDINSEASSARPLTGKYLLEKHFHFLGKELQSWRSKQQGHPQ